MGNAVTNPTSQSPDEEKPLWVTVFEIVVISVVVAGGTTALAILLMS